MTRFSKELIIGVLLLVVFPVIAQAGTLVSTGRIGLNQSGTGVETSLKEDGSFSLLIEAFNTSGGRTVFADTIERPDIPAWFINAAETLNAEWEEEGLPDRYELPGKSSAYISVRCEQLSGDTYVIRVRVFWSFSVWFSSPYEEGYVTPYYSGGDEGDPEDDSEQGILLSESYIFTDNGADGLNGTEFMKVSLTESFGDFLVDEEVAEPDTTPPVVTLIDGERFYFPSALPTGITTMNLHVDMSDDGGCGHSYVPGVILTIKADGTEQVLTPDPAEVWPYCFGELDVQFTPDTLNTIEVEAWDRYGNYSKEDWTIDVPEEPGPIEGSGRMVVSAPRYVPNELRSVMVSGIVTHSDGIASVYVYGSQVPTNHTTKVSDTHWTFETPVPLIAIGPAGVATTEVEVFFNYGDGNGTSSDKEKVYITAIDPTILEPEIACSVNLDGNPEVQVDIVVGSATLTFERRYASNDPYIGPFGRGRTHSYNIQLARCTDGNKEYVVVRRPCQRRMLFERQEDGTFKNTLPLPYDLTEDENGLFTIHLKDGRQFHFNELGFVEEITDANSNVIAFDYDAENKLVKVADSSQNELVISYSSHQIENVSDHTGRSVFYTYETGALGSPLLKTCSLGDKSTTYLYNEQELLTGIIGAESHLLQQYSYDALERPVSRTYGAYKVGQTVDWSARTITEEDSIGRTLIRWFNDDKLITKTQDSYGAVHQYTYHPVFKKPTQLIDSEGKVTNVSYDNEGRISSVVKSNGTSMSAKWTRINGKDVTEACFNSLGNATYYEHDQFGNTTFIVYPNGGTVQYEYDSLGRVIYQKDSNQSVTRFKYSEAGNLISIIDPLGYTTDYEYDPLGNKIMQVDKRGYSTTFSYDEHRRITDILYPDKTKFQKLTYDKNGRVLTVNFSGRTKKYKYDAIGNHVETEWPDGTTTKYGRDLLGRMVSSVDIVEGIEIPSSRVSLEYDEHDNVTAMTENGKRSEYLFDLKNRLLQETDLNGRKSAYEYNSEVGYLSRMVDLDGFETQLEYDSHGRLLALRRPDGLSEFREYNEYNELIKSGLSSTDNAANRKYEYNTAGQLTTIVANGREYSYEYRHDGLVTKTILPGGASYVYDYDASGNLIKTISPSGKSRQFSYDALNRMASITTNTGKTKTFAYNEHSDVIYTKDYKGQETSHSYNLNHKRVFTKAGADEYRWEYDYLGNMLKTFVNGNVVKQNWYSEDKLLTRVHYPELERSVLYSYDVDGDVAKVSVVDTEEQIQCSKEYFKDDDSNQQIIVDESGRKTTVIYDSLGRLVDIERPDGTFTTKSYDLLGRLEQVQHKNSTGSVIYRCFRQYNDSGTCASENKLDGLTSYTYDDLGRLDGAIYPDGRTINYGYDADGNLKYKQSNSTRIDFEYDGENCLISAGNTLFEYDENGCRIKSINETGTTTYHWSYESKLTRIESPNGNIREYTYLPQDWRRLSVKTNEDLRKHVYDGNNVFSVIDGNNITIEKHYSLFGLDNRIYMDTGDALYGFLADASKNIIGITNSDTQSIEKLSYSPFGATDDDKSSGGPFYFDGRKYDNETGLYFFRARYYDSETCQFISPDPLGESRPNDFRFSGQNPITQGDPTGLIQASDVREYNPAWAVRTIKTVIPVLYTVSHWPLAYRQWQIDLEGTSHTVGAISSTFDEDVDNPLYVKFEESFKQGEDEAGYLNFHQSLIRVTEKTHLPSILDIFSGPVSYFCHGYSFGTTETTFLRHRFRYFNPLRITEILESHFTGPGNEPIDKDNIIELLNSELCKKSDRIVIWQEIKKDPYHSMVVSDNGGLIHKMNTEGKLEKNDGIDSLLATFDNYMMSAWAGQPASAYRLNLGQKGY